MPLPKRPPLWPLLVGLLLAAGCSHGSNSNSPAVTQAKNVIILVIDGPRQSEMWRDPARTHIPRLNGELAPQGVLLSGFKNNGPTYTTSGHTAITTGFYEDLDNTVGSTLPSHAGIFQYFLQSSGLPKEKAWIIATKDKLRILGDTTEADWQGQYVPSLWCGLNGVGPGYGEDVDTVTQAKSVLALHHPNLMLINLKQPDAAGHTGIWADYLNGIEASDAAAAELWRVLQADAFYRGRTALFVVHDHGRHLDGLADGFVSHGDGCVGCRSVALLALGPDFQLGHELSTGGELIDLPVTVAALLGFRLPGTQGRQLVELYPPHP